MQQVLHFGAAESLSGIWSALHRDVEFAVSANEIHYLWTMALAMDDDLVSSLLLKKLKLAERFEPQGEFLGIVEMNSFVEFDFGSEPRSFGQLVHPSPHSPNYGISITSLRGAGLLGLRAGQTILWPNDRGTLCDLHLARVENCPGMTDWLSGTKT